MAEKISTLILKVDLDCNLCYKKIRKTLSKLQEREPIQSIVYDEKNNTVLVSGPFDPHRMIKKICCKACKVIKDIQIKENKPKETEPAKEKPAEKPKEPVESKKDKPNGNGKAKDAAEPKKDKPKPDEPTEQKKDKPKTVESDPPPAVKPVKADPLPVGQTTGLGTGCQPVWPSGLGCYCRPWYERYYGDYKGCTCGCGGGHGQGYYGEYRGCTCGCGGGGGHGQGYYGEYRGCTCGCGGGGGHGQGYYGEYRGCTCGCGGGHGPYGWAPERPPIVVYSGPAYGGGGGYQTCKFICEEDPQSSCSVM